VLTAGSYHGLLSGSTPGQGLCIHRDLACLPFQRGFGKPQPRPPIGYLLRVLEVRIEVMCLAWTMHGHWVVRFGYVIDMAVPIWPVDQHDISETNGYLREDEIDSHLKAFSIGKFGKFFFYFNGLFHTVSFALVHVMVGRTRRRPLRGAGNS